MLLLFVVLFIVVVLLVLWLAAVLYMNDFTLPAMQTKSLSHVLLVYAHPDDEVVGAGGLMHRLASRGVRVTLVTLTEGEQSRRGDLSVAELRAVRKLELKRATELLGVAKLIHADFGDKALRTNYAQAKDFLARVLAEEQPDAVITHDPAGLYGHPDHLACSQMLTELMRDSYRDTAFWYSTLPQRALSLIPLPEELRKVQALPNCKLALGLHLLPKIRAFYAHKSQLKALTMGKPIPIWLLYSLFVCEYFYAIPADH